MPASRKRRSSAIATGTCTSSGRRRRLSSAALNSAIWLDRLEAEHDNLRAALSWSLNDPRGADAALELAAGLWRFWEIRGYLTEGRQWIERVLAVKSDEVSATRGDVLTAAGIMAANQGDHAAAVRFHEQSLAIHEELGDLKSVQFALNNLANAAMHQGDIDRARELYERVASIINLNEASSAFVLVSLADVIDQQGDYAGARARYEQAITLMRTGPDVWPTAYALSSYGQAAARHGDVATAHDRYEQALEVYRQRR